MGGEWWFNIRETCADQGSKTELKTYQECLQSFKIQHEKDFGNNAVWASEEEIKTSNVFATFTYECMRHDWGPAGHKPQWKLFWNPWKVSKDERGSDVHARCAPYDFKLLSDKIQKKLVRDYFKVFEQYWGDGIDGFRY